MQSDGLLASFANAFGQENRLLRLRFAPGSGMGEETLLAQRFSGREQLSGCYRYELECLSADGFLELKTLLGQPIEVAILQADGREHVRCGLVTEARRLGADGGFARYGLAIEPALATLRHRLNSRVFQDKSVPQIVAAILDEHLAANAVFALSFAHEANLTQTYPQRSYCNQYRESDFALIERLLFEEGIAYCFRFGADGSDSAPRHTLVLFDEPMNLSAHAQQRIRFHRADGTEREDSITEWGGARSLQAGASHIASFDYKRVSLHEGAEASAIDQGDTGTRLASTLQDYDPQTHYYAGGADEGARYARLRQSARDQAAKSFQGEGSTRGLLAGQWFQLADHPVHDQDDEARRQFVVTGLEFEANNNLPQDLSKGLPALFKPSDANASPPPYTNRFTAVRRGVPLTPSYGHSTHAKPTARGVTTGTVVGPAGEEIYTDEYGRIKVQFHWQRPQDHPEGGANRDEQSSCWIRVAYPSAGANWGSQYIPRIGQEVLIGFIEDDIDRPVVMGALYNGTQMPPSYSGAGSLPANKTLSGIKSKEYKGARYNELLFDDATNETRAKLSSEHAKTQLNLGYLVHPRTEGKGEPRGEGFELRTDAAGALRAAQGILISAQARMQAASTQLDRAELLGILKVLEGLHQHLSKLSDTHHADDADTDKLSTLKTHIENWENGSNTKSGKPDPTGGKPVIALDAPAGIALTSHDNVVVGANTHIDLVSTENTQLSVGRRLLLRAVESASLFVHQLGMKLIAAGGKVIIEAHNDNIETTSAKKTIISALEEIILRAPKVTIETQGAKAQIGDGSISTECIGAHTQKAASHSRTGPGGGSFSGQTPASAASYDEKFVLTFSNGMPMRNLSVRIKDAAGKLLWSGTTNSTGETGLTLKDLPQDAQVEFV